MANDHLGLITMTVTACDRNGKVLGQLKKTGGDGVVRQWRSQEAHQQLRKEHPGCRIHIDVRDATAADMKA